MTTYTRPVTGGTPTTGQVVKAVHVNEPVDQIYDTILAGGITSDQIAAGAVDTSELATAAVTAAKMDGTLPDASAMATSAAPTIDKQLANKKYVDDQDAAGVAGQWHHDGSALNGGNAVSIPTPGTYVTVATGLSNRALCYIKVQLTAESGGGAAITVIDDDETGDFAHEKFNANGGVARTFIGLNEFGLIVVECNASGDIKITVDADAGNEFKLWLQGYVQ